MLYKYEHIVFGVLQQINSGKLSKGEKLPSINEVHKNIGYSRMTIDKAYKCLIQQGVMKSFRLKGYFLTGKKVSGVHLTSLEP